MDSELFYEDLLLKAFSVLEDNSSIVIGSLGVDTKDFKRNEKLFKEYIYKLQRKNIKIFDQIPYLDIYLKNSPKDYSKKFEIFYKGIIQSGKIKKIFVIPNWEKSLGVITEINFAKEKNIEIEYLD